MGYPEYPDYFLFEDNTARGPDKSYGAIYPAIACWKAPFPSSCSRLATD
jgi:hypothetical protein